MNNYVEHISVLKKECLHFLTEKISPNEKSYFADLTFGAGGHSKAILETNPNVNLWSTDQDPDALKNGALFLKEQADEGRFHLLNMNFKSFPEYFLKSHQGLLLDGILMDLGVSSHHFDKGERGFSFRFEAPLDMRMNHSDPSIPTAADLLNTLPEKDLADLIYEYGEERLSRTIARKVIEERQKRPIETTKELENLVFHSYPPKMRFSSVHPATRTFQALRIAVNRELDVLTETIPQLIPLLKKGARLAIISFHSLEDRIVKHSFKEIDSKNEILILTKKPIGPTEDEIKNNFRSRSAKLRVIEKL